MKALRIVIGIILAIAGLILLLWGMGFRIEIREDAPNSSASEKVKETKPIKETKPAQTKPEHTQTEPEELIILDNEYVTMKYRGISDISFTDKFLYLTIETKNNSDQSVYVMLDDISLDDEMVPIPAVIPSAILPDKRSSFPFDVVLEGTSIKSVDDVDKISFKVSVTEEENFTEIYRSDEITLDLR